MSQKDEDILVKFGQIFLSVGDLRQREDVSYYNCYKLYILLEGYDIFHNPLPSLYSDTLYRTLRAIASYSFCSTRPGMEPNYLSHMKPVPKQVHHRRGLLI